MSGYTERVVVFVDVLGWSETCKTPSCYADLFGATTRIANYAANFSSQTKEQLAQAIGATSKHCVEHAGLEFAFFSDNFVVSAPSKHGKAVFAVVAWSFHELLRLGFLLRGGVTVGDLHHDSRVVFGPALVEAVKIERDAQSPGVHCSGALSKFLRREGYEAEVAFLDSDNQLVVNLVVGSTYALSDCLKIVTARLATPMAFAHRCKWQYVAEMLPRMYSASKRTSLESTARGGRQS